MGKKGFAFLASWLSLFFPPNRFLGQVYADAKVEWKKSEALGRWRQTRLGIFTRPRSWEKRENGRKFGEEKLVERDGIC